MSRFWDFILNLFRPRKTPVSTPTLEVPAGYPFDPKAAPTPVTGAAEIINRKVLLVVFDPVVDPVSKQKLSQHLNWKRVDDLSSGFLSDVLESSGSLARYQIVQRVELDEFPLKKDGFRYTAQSYLDVLSKKTPAHEPDAVDYDDLLKRFNILQRVATGEIDEVWFFSFPYGGFYESTMGGMGAFWCNSPALPNTSQCPRKFILMGFSYQRGVGEMHESFCHRYESMMERVYMRATPDKNLWAQFIRYDKTHPGESECGNVHFAPNSERDYDWGNQRFVESYCDDWLNFPNFTRVKKRVNCADWGNGEIRAHHVWWLKRMPKVPGSIHGVSNNWWLYVMDPNRMS